MPQAVLYSVLSIQRCARAHQQIASRNHMNMLPLSCSIRQCKPSQEQTQRPHISCVCCRHVSRSACRAVHAAAMLSANLAAAARVRSCISAKGTSVVLLSTPCHALAATSLGKSLTPSPPPVCTIHTAYTACAAPAGMYYGLGMAVTDMTLKLAACVPCLLSCSHM